MSMNGNTQTGPLKMPLPIIDIMAAHQTKEAILIALIKRHKTGKGTYITVSLYDAAIASLANQASNWLMAGHLPATSGSLHPNIAPYGEVFKTKDNKKLLLAVGNDSQFKKLCEVLNATKISNSAFFKTNTQRVKNRVLLHKKLTVPILSFPSKKLLLLLEKQKIPAAICKNLKEVFATTKAKKMVITSTNKTKRVKNAIFKFSN